MPEFDVEFHFDDDEVTVGVEADDKEEAIIAARVKLTNWISRLAPEDITVYDEDGDEI